MRTGVVRVHWTGGETIVVASGYRRVRVARVCSGLGVRACARTRGRREVRERGEMGGGDE
jgi:hypothetical protein